MSLFWTKPLTSCLCNSPHLFPRIVKNECQFRPELSTLRITQEGLLEYTSEQENKGS